MISRTARLTAVLLGLTAVVGAFQQAAGQAVSYYYSATEGFWNEAGKWSPPGPPKSIYWDSGLIGAPPTGTAMADVTITNNAVAKYLYVGYGTGGNGTLRLLSGELKLMFTLYIGCNGGQGVFDMSGGRLTCLTYASAISIPYGAGGAGRWTVRGGQVVLAPYDLIVRSGGTFSVEGTWSDSRLDFKTVQLQSGGTMEGVIDEGGVTTTKASRYSGAGGTATFAAGSKLKLRLAEGVSFPGTREFTLLTAAGGIANSGLQKAGDNTNDWSFSIVSLGGGTQSLVVAYTYRGELLNLVAGADGGGVAADFLIAPTETTVADYVRFLNAQISGQVAVTNGVARWAATQDALCLTTLAEPQAYVAYDAAQPLGQRFAAVPERDLHPMIYVSWRGAAAYCNWKSAETGLGAVYDATAGWTADPAAAGFRLPTESEWYKAAAWDSSAAVFRVYGTSADSLSRGDANFLNSLDAFEGNAVRTCPIRTFATASPYGLKDCTGNVWEWCQDFFDPARTNAADPRALRGGAWGNLAVDLKTTTRIDNAPDAVRNSVGFRVSRTGSL